MPSDILLSQLTGEQWAEMRQTYNRLPTPLERIEIILSLLINAFATTETQFKGSVIPDRFELYREVTDRTVTEQEEDAILSNLALHMTAHNAARGA